MRHAARAPLSIVRNAPPALPPTFPTFRLTFMLPPALGLIAPGLHLPARDGCQVRVDRSGLVHCTGGSRRQVFEHTSRFLRSIGKDCPDTLIVGVLTSPHGYWAGSSGRDSWSLAFVDGKTVFAPTGLGAEVFPVIDRVAGEGA